MKYKQLVKNLMISCLAIFLCTACSRKQLLIFVKPAKPFTTAKIPTPPDYGHPDSWHKINLRDTYKLVDVFFIHPTTYIVGKNWNQDLQDEHVNWRTRVLPMAHQASLFYDDARMFIPKYRQGIFYSFVDAKDNGQQALEIAYQDVKEAFDHYIKHYNNGRPFILATHSQGSFHCQKLLKEIAQQPEIQKQLIVTYALGWPIEQAYIEEEVGIEVCSTANQTNCIISWNVESGDPKMSLVKEMGKGKKLVCVNPLSWSTDTIYMPKGYNKGALIHNKKEDKSELILYYCDAQIKDNAIKITPPSNLKQLQMPMGKGNYHLYDYSFFYQNIKQNARDRVAAFYEEKTLTLQEAK